MGVSKPGARFYPLGSKRAPAALLFRRHTIPHPDSLFNFDRARRKAFIQQLLSLITGQPQDLLSFEEAQHLRSCAPADTRFY